MKLDSTGSHLWTFQSGSSAGEIAYSVVNSAFGDVVTADITEGGLDGNSNAGSWDLFVTKLDSAGSRLWTYQAGTSSSDIAAAVDIDASGNIVVVGLTAGGLSGNSNAGNEDIFVTKLHSSMSHQWTYQTGTTGTDVALAVRIDSSSDSVVVGHTQGALHGNSNTGGDKLDGTGSRKWTYRTGTSEADWAIATALDVSGNILVTGFTLGGLHGYSNAGSRDVFVLELDSAGSWQWTFQTGTSSFDVPRAIRQDSSRNILLACFTRDVAFDGHSSAGSYDMFAMKLSGPTTTSTSASTTLTTVTSTRTMTMTLTTRSSSSTTSTSSSATSATRSSTSSSSTTNKKFFEYSKHFFEFYHRNKKFFKYHKHKKFFKYNKHFFEFHHRNKKFFEYNKHIFECEKYFFEYNKYLLECYHDE